MKTIPELPSYFDSTLHEFNHDWRFAAPGSASSVTVDLPHAWNDVGWNYEGYQPTAPKGTGIYRKKLPAFPPGQGRAALKFSGVSALARVLLNGEVIAENLGAHTAFQAPLDTMIGDGTDEICVEVTDKPSVPLLQPIPNSPFQQSSRYKLWALPIGSSMSAGGIWREVQLVTHAECRIDSLRVESFQEELLVFPDRELPEHVTLHLALNALEATICGNSIQLKNAELYTPEHPYCYQLTAELRYDGEVFQTIHQAVAFREFVIRDSEFYLNGQPIFLRGQNGLPHCNVPHDREYIAKFVHAVREQGVEISRFHTEPPSHEWLDECDRQGLMIVLEMAIHGSMGCYAFDHPDFVRVAEREMRSVVAEYRRHPSIVLWCLGNEMTVSTERDLGLCEPLFDLLNDWTSQLHLLDSRPVIGSSNGDGIDSVRKQVADVDVNHQYGGWYVETLRDLRNYEKIVTKNDTSFQPMLVMESIAGYTDNDGHFFIRSNDERQKKVVRQRLGQLDASAETEQRLQCFILKEYAEMMWRLRRKDSEFSGFIPFGQYTWFRNPFDKSASGIQCKMIWNTYRMVMGPCHIQLESFDRHLFQSGSITGALHFYHENRLIEPEIDVTVQLFLGTSAEKAPPLATIHLGRVRYHESLHRNITIALPQGVQTGKNVLTIQARRSDAPQTLLAQNTLDLRIYAEPQLGAEAKTRIFCYDPAGKLAQSLSGCQMLSGFAEWSAALPEQCANMSLLLGPYAWDGNIEFHTPEILEFARRGGQIVVLEQNPASSPRPMLQTNLTIVRKLQPYWSRWARNLNRYADRADLIEPGHRAFRDMEAEDFAWWNSDSFVGTAYLSSHGIQSNDKILLSVCDGLSDGELMPVEHPELPCDSSLLMLERTIPGKNGCPDGKICFVQALIGSKCATEPVARKLLFNLLSD